MSPRPHAPAEDGVSPTSPADPTNGRNSRQRLTLSWAGRPVVVGSGVGILAILLVGGVAWFGDLIPGFGPARPAEGESEGPPRPRLSDRMGSIEGRLAGLEAATGSLKHEASETRIDVAEAKRALSRVAESYEKLEDRIGRMESDARVRHDRVLDELDELGSKLRRGR